MKESQTLSLRFLPSLSMACSILRPSILLLSYKYRTSSFCLVSAIHLLKSMCSVLHLLQCSCNGSRKIACDAEMDKREFSSYSPTAIHDCYLNEPTKKTLHVPR